MKAGKTVVAKDGNTVPMYCDTREQVFPWIARWYTAATMVRTTPATACGQIGSDRTPLPAGVGHRTPRPIHHARFRTVGPNQPTA